MPAVNYPTNIRLIDEIVKWAGNNAPILAEIYSQKGGWEGWAQVELARAIPGWLGGSCSREYREVYTNHDRADIFHENPLTNRRNVIELKCQSAFQDDTNIAGFGTQYSIAAGRIQPANRQGFNQNTDTCPVVFWTTY
ncbi:hypothetical protein B0H63DRAFT_514157 [Podospora didyma]|uniref:Uncharacterized protein n=1 Tax=Podospora didyma TaxID=330526 RepID=A0AAE0K4D7_9PEZI|nr:hypothetical protein B0H63DRAFT_514157 [Podospora didyma]